LGLLKAVHFCWGALVDPKRTDFSLMKAWLTECKILHNKLMVSETRVCICVCVPCVNQEWFKVVF